MTDVPSDPPHRAVDIFLRYLKAEGARAVFGIPGGLLHPFFAAIEEDDDLSLVISRHEEGAAFMADGYARVSGGIAVCAGTSGPGATNLMTGVAVAFSDGVPMLVLTGQAASHALGKGAAQETPPEDIDIVAMFRPVTKYSAMVPSPQTMGHHLRRALRRALSGRPGPVHLNVPVDFWDKPVTESWYNPETYRTTTRAFDRTEVQRAAETLLSAEHPALFVGSGAAGAEDSILSLAEMLPARVATTPRAKGIFPEDHPLSLGVLGFAGHRPARATLLGDTIDVLFTVGASLNETSTFNWHRGLQPRGALLQCDIDVDRIGRNYPVDIPLVGDANTITVELIYHLHRSIREGSGPASAWQAEPNALAEEQRYDEVELRRSSAVPLTPQRWRADLTEVLPSDAIVFSDIGGHMLFNVHDLCIGRDQQFVLNLGFGSMGHGTAAPIGAALGGANRPIVAIIGDGCLTMNGMELLTAADYGIPVVWIVETNQMHGITWHGSQQVGDGRPMDSVRFKKPLDVSGLARALGLQAWRVDEPGEMQRILPQALAIAGPAVIEVTVDPMIPPPLGDRARSIAGFIDK